MKNMNDPLETEEQQALFAWAKLTEKKNSKLSLLYAIPNGGYRAKATAARLKREGVKKGVPDICFPVPNKKYHGLYIELKRKHSGSASKEQKEWLQELNSNGYRARICQGFDEAIQEIEEYLSIE